MTARAGDFPRHIKVAEPAASTLWWLWVPLLVVLAIAPVLNVFDGKPPIRPTFESWSPLVILPLVMLGLTLMYRRRRIVLEPTQLDITSTFYRRRVALDSLELERARVVSLEEHTELKPALKTNGYQVPGFRSGHFRMRDGSRCFCLVTDNSKVLALPLRDGSWVLASPENPRQLLDELRELATPGTAH
jgi:hypothetical protein